MVSTRTQTGTIATKHYDLLTLQLQGTTSQPTSPTTARPKHTPKPKLASKPKSPISKRHALPRKPSTSKTPRSHTTAKPKPPFSPTARATSPLGFDLKSKAFQEQMMLNYLPTQMVDVCDGINFFPGRCWGEREERGLSAIERAEREVEIWEEVRRSHREGGQEGMVPMIEAVVEREREKMADLRRREREGEVELGRAGVENPGEVVIKERLETLEWALSTSKYESEAENIRGAIAGYRSGLIGYTKHFTLIYAGRVVDTAPTYGSFVTDRQERLDRYAAAHGPHWLWYEPPLNVHPESQPKMLRSLSLHRADTWSNLGCWDIVQGFWKRSGWVARMPQTSGTQPSSLEPNFWRGADGKVFCQEAGPKQAFRSCLDSGATFPSLYKQDFKKLMIDEENYACQSVALNLTANGPIMGRMFELFVCVLDNDQKQLVDENHCAWPYHAKYLGGLCPVVEMAGVPHFDAEGREVQVRLSGMLPFVACYISSTPTRSTMFFGEDRKDILGSHRIPGQRKWDIAMPNGPPIPEVTWERYRDPKTQFWHRDGKIIDEDDPNIDFAHTVTFMKGTPQEYIHRTCPKEEVEALRSKEAAGKAAEDLNREIAARQQQRYPTVPTAGLGGTFGTPSNTGWGQQGGATSTPATSNSTSAWNNQGGQASDTGFSGQPVTSWMTTGGQQSGMQNVPNLYVPPHGQGPELEDLALSPEGDDMDTRDGGIKKVAKEHGNTPPQG